jgi:hypothetical protein
VRHSAKLKYLFNEPEAAKDITNGYQEHHIIGYLKSVTCEWAGQVVGGVRDDPVDGRYPRKKVFPLIYLAVVDLSPVRTL